MSSSGHQRRFERKPGASASPHISLLATKRRFEPTTDNVDGSRLLQNVLWFWSTKVSGLPAALASDLYP